MVREVLEEDEETEMEPSRTEGCSHSPVGHLDEQQQHDLIQVQNNFPSLFQDRPGRTEVIEHNIILKDPTPIRQRPYRIPERMVQAMEEEVRTMLQMAIIEPSKSEWSSPVVLVPKKDGSIRFCTDFRKQLCVLL